ncbi:hypothetical protein KDL44_08975 [bacterium]|nr:hypothetical protein [bacterium]
MRKGIVNLYRLSWLALILLFGLLIWWFVLRSPEAIRLANEFDPDSIKRLPLDKEEQEAQQAAEQTEQTFAELAPSEISVDDADFEITGPDGRTQMKLWVRRGVREGSEFRLEEGAMRLQRDDSVVLLSVTDGLFASEEGSVRVEGSITGELQGRDMFFESRHLVWDQNGNTVQTDTVRYIGPFVDVTAEHMNLNLVTGEVEFAGPLTAGI